MEWPIESNYSKAKELTNLFKLHGVRNVVGLQEDFTPIATRINAMILAGDIGRVESSTFIGTMRGGAVMASNMDYFIDKTVGGNAFTVSFRRSMEYITRGMRILGSSSVSQFFLG